MQGRVTAQNMSVILEGEAVIYLAQVVWLAN